MAAPLWQLRRVDAESLRAIRKDVSRQVVAEPARAVIRLAMDIVEREPPGGYAIAYELIHYHPTAVAHITPVICSGLADGCRAGVKPTLQRAWQGRHGVRDRDPPL